MTKHRFLSLYGLFSLFFLVLYACSAQSTAMISQIENNIIPTSKSGVEKGKPQALLARMKALKIPGLSIAVFDQGQIIWTKGYGLQDKNSGNQVDTATVFQAASISKPVTSVAMLGLVEKNKINLDEDVNLQLRSWQIPGNEYTSVEKVNPKRIVSHTAGLSVAGFSGYGQKDNIPDLIQILDGVPPAHSKPVRVVLKPGTQEMYSGGGFTVLQLLLQDITGKPFAEVMEELVLHPAGMAHSKFALQLPEQMKQNWAKGHFSNGKMLDGGYNLYPEQAAAGLWTTPADFARFMLNVSHAYQGQKGILQQKTVQMMLTKVPNGNALGFGVEGTENTLRFQHSGRNQGYACYAVSFAHTGRGVVVMTNSDNGSQLIREVVRAVYRVYGWEK